MRSLLMGHEPAGGTQGQPDEVGRVQEVLRKLNHAMAAFITARTHMSVEEYEAKIAHGGELWLTYDEAIRLGFTDGFAVRAKDLIEEFKRLDATRAKR